MAIASGDLKAVSTRLVKRLLLMPGQRRECLPRLRALVLSLVCRAVATRAFAVRSVVLCERVAAGARWFCHFPISLGVSYSPDQLAEEPPVADRASAAS
jgi:hypothetical protein